MILVGQETGATGLIIIIIIIIIGIFEFLIRPTMGIFTVSGSIRGCNSQAATREVPLGTCGSSGNRT